MSEVHKFNWLLAHIDAINLFGYVLVASALIVALWFTFKR